MTCNLIKKSLALHAGGDLPASQADAVNRHVASCAECQEFAENLERNHFLLRSLRPGAVPSSVLAEVRHGIVARIGDGEQVLGWRVRFERFLLLGFRKPLYAVAGFAIALLSVTLLAQIQHPEPEAAGPVAIFDARDTLLRPEGYREWIFVGSAVGSGHSQGAGGQDTFRNIYINPAAYREYAKTGKFPEGTVMVLESARVGTNVKSGGEHSYESDFLSLQTSVKDSRFDGGWGYFDFTDDQGELMAKAVPESAACISCHRDQGGNDHVFTQFYPVLRSLPGVL